MRWADPDRLVSEGLTQENLNRRMRSKPRKDGYWAVVREHSSKGVWLIGQLDDRYGNLTIPGLQLQQLEHEAKAVRLFLASRFFYPVK